MIEKKDLTERVKELVEQVDKTHRYSMSAISDLWNEAFGKNEAPVSCASCLIRKTNDLRKWLGEQNAQQAETTDDTKKKKSPRRKKGGE